MAPEGEGCLELEAWVRRAFKEERPLSEVVDTTLLVTDMLMIFLAVVVVETHLNAMVHHRNRPKTMVVIKFCTMLCALSDDHEPDDRAVHRAAQGWLVAKHLTVTAAAAIILLTARITMDFHCGTLSLCGC